MPTTEERLARIEANTDRILKALDGNGQPGLIPQFARMNAWLEAIESRVAAVEASVEQRTRSGVVGGVAGSVSTASLFSALAIILQKMGVIKI